MRILLTGASGGIGSALAEQLYKDGNSLLLQGRNEAALEQLAKGIDPALSRVQWIPADINQVEDRTRLVAAAEKFSADTLISNAGINEFGRFKEASIETVIQTNVTSTMLITQAMLPVLMSQAAPTIVTVGSTFGSIGYPGYVSYCASKYALKGFSEALKREYAADKLCVIYVSPRATKTGMNSPCVTEMNSALGTASDSPELVAAQIARALQKRTARVQLGWKEWLQIKLNGLFPSIVDHAIKGQLGVIQQYLNQESKNEISHGNHNVVPIDASGNGSISAGSSEGLGRS